ncbi:MAG: hydrogenase maturation protease [Candidatus Thermoplasmatota archaeon]|nr:hydrogenase maturation protease [Candidatus Thermoplasmatota archaeon]
MKRVAVIGLGNPFRKDDGIGIKILDYIKLKKNILSGGIEIIDGGTGGMNLLHLITKFDLVFIIDAVNFNKKIGEIEIFDAKNLKSVKPFITQSTHCADFLNIIELSKKLGQVPDKIFIIGIHPGDTSFGNTISSELEKNIPVYLEKIFKKINKEISNLTDELSG